MSAVAISQDQRKKLGLPGQEAGQTDQQRAPDLERVQEGQEISADAAERLQPQMGNQAVQALLDRTSSTTQSSTGTADLDLAEDLSRGEDEEFEGGTLEMPTVEMGGGGDGAPVEVAPWEVGRLFGGDDDATNPRRPKPIPKARRQVARNPTTSAPPEHGDLLDEVHADRIEALLGATPSMPEELRSGDARYRAIEAGLTKPHAIGRRTLRPESMVDRTDHLDPIGRATAIARFLGTAASRASSRAVARCVAGPVSALLPSATGHAGAAARLAALVVCAEACEDGGTPTDNAIRLALCHEAWPAALASASALAKTGRVVAPDIVEHAGERLAEPVDSAPRTDTTTAALTGVRLGRHALLEILPDTPLTPIPPIPFAQPPASPIQDPNIAAVDAVLAEYTGGAAPTDLPDERRLEARHVQPVLDAATELVNRMGQTQVELAAAAIALARVQPGLPVRTTLIHTDRAMRELARAVVRHGDQLHRAIGVPDAATNKLPERAVAGLRQSASAFDALRTWSLNAIAEAMHR